MRTSLVLAALAGASGTAHADAPKATPPTTVALVSAGKGPLQKLTTADVVSSDH